MASDGTVTTGLSAQGKTNGVLYWDVPHDSATVYYVCSSHGAMNGTLEVARKEGGKLLQQVNTQTGVLRQEQLYFLKTIQYLKILKVMNI